MAEPLEDFEAWLLHRVAQAVEAAEVSADLLVELQAVIESAREAPQEASEAAAIHQVAELVGISEEKAARALSAIETHTTRVRHRLLRGIAEAWLKDHQEAYRRRQRTPGS
jgi:hypothetical protein